MESEGDSDSLEEVYNKLRHAEAILKRNQRMIDNIKQHQAVHSQESLQQAEDKLKELFSNSKEVVQASLPLFPTLYNYIC